MKKILVCFIIMVLLLTGCSTPTEQKIDGVKINLSDEKITVDGKAITNDNAQAVYSANDIVFFLAGQDFTYGEGTKEDEHEQSEADAHTVVHISKPGRYVLSGKLTAGQIAVDLGEDAEKNPEAVVTLILNGVDITCTVAPAVIFYNVYECSVADEENATKDVDTSAAGANIIVADGSENNINGSYVAEIYKSYELNEDGTEVIDSKKLHKYDAAFYSKKTMNINGGDIGDGILNIKAENEGLDSELHLTINGGNINITSGNDGINTNEDNVSVTTVNGGTLNILCDGTTGEGDGIDSNGWLVINGGTVVAQACATSGDAGIDSDSGIYINGGNVIASGNMLDRIVGGEQTYAIFSFAARQTGNSIYTLKNAENKVIGKYSPTNDFAYLLVAGDELVAGDYTFWQDDTQLSAYSTGNMQGEKPMGDTQQPPENMNGERPQPPENIENPPEMPENMTRPDGEPPRMPTSERPEMPNGERHEMPDGAENITHPDNMAGMMGNNMVSNDKVSTIFTLVKGGNQFTNVCNAE
ncbi:MAG: carbohydrate-binding domain-containing protein [Clostridia bacterium]|nr:carbohydrate-binding domain-containing protein [Clostridia bacterium]